MDIFFLWLILSFVAGAIASAKGRSGVGFFFLAFLLSPLVGIVVALVARSGEALGTEKIITYGKWANSKQCPFCSETIHIEAIKCKHCRSIINPRAMAERQA